MRSDSDRIPILTNRERGPMFRLIISQLSFLREKRRAGRRREEERRNILEYPESLLLSRMLIHPIKLFPYLHNYHQYHHRVWVVLDDYSSAQDLRLPIGIVRNEKEVTYIHYWDQAL